MVHRGSRQVAAMPHSACVAVESWATRTLQVEQHPASRLPFCGQEPKKGYDQDHTKKHGNALYSLPPLLGRVSGPVYHAFTPPLGRPVVGGHEHMFSGVQAWRNSKNASFLRTPR